MTTTAQPPSRPTRPSRGDSRWSPRLWGALILLCGVLFLDGLDVSMVGVALPSIGSELSMSTSSLQWVVSGYVLGYGGFLLLGGRTADLLGRRRVLLIALGVFAVASLLGGLVDDADAADRDPLHQGRRAPRSPRRPACPSSPRPSPRARPATAP